MRKDDMRVSLFLGFRRLRPLNVDFGRACQLLLLALVLACLVSLVLQAVASVASQTDGNAVTQEQTKPLRDVRRFKLAYQDGVKFVVAAYESSSPRKDASLDDQEGAAGEEDSAEPEEEEEVNPFEEEAAAASDSADVASKRVPVQDDTSKDNAVQAPDAPRPGLVQDAPVAPSHGDLAQDTGQDQFGHSPIHPNQIPQDQNDSVKVMPSSTSSTQSPASTAVAKKSPPSPEPFVVEGWPPEKSRDTKDYVQHDIDRSLIKPTRRKLPKEFHHVSVLIGVQSAPGNFASRQEIRDSWGLVCSRMPVCDVFFSLGTTSNSTIQSMISEESNIFGDLLQDDFVDSYNNLTLKTVHMLRHFKFEQHKHFLKTDDDSFVGIGSLLKVMQTHIMGQNETLIGFLQLGRMREAQINSAVAKSWPKSHKFFPKMSQRLRKWVMPTYMYAPKSYPPFLSGSGYLMDRSVAECLLEKSKVVSIIFLEDVYATGLCAEECNAVRYHHPGFNCRRKPKNFKIQSWHVIVHYMEGKMKQLQAQLDEVQKLP